MMKGMPSTERPLRDGAVRGLENSTTDWDRWNRWEQCAVGGEKNYKKKEKTTKQKLIYTKKEKKKKSHSSSESSGSFGLYTLIKVISRSGGK